MAKNDTTDKPVAAPQGEVAELVAKAPTAATHDYYLPDQGVTVEASSLEEAIATVNQSEEKK